MSEDQAEPVGVEVLKTWERPQLAILNANEAEDIVGLARGLLAS